MSDLLVSLIPWGIGVVVVIILALLLMSMYKVAPPDKAMVITGLGKPKVKVASGGFVIPKLQKVTAFDLCMLTVSAKNDTIMTTDGVPIKVDWTAQIRPDISGENHEPLMKAVRSFLERGSDGIRSDVQLTLTGSVRDVVASMTPIGVLREKAKFAEDVKKAVGDEMSGMGLELVSLNIQDVYDDNGYYINYAAAEREQKRREAENATAEANRAIREKAAESDKQGTEAELDAQLAIAAKTRDNALKQAIFKEETDKAQANAAIAGQLQQTVREQELAAEAGRAEVVRQEQAALAAKTRQEVAITEAETEKRQKTISAEASAEMARLAADGKAKALKVEAEGTAEAARLSARGKADAVQIEADAAAKATKLAADAEAEKTRKTGMAEADATKAKALAEAEGIQATKLAEAEGIKALKLAEAEGDRALAEARAAEEGVNFEIAKMEIEANARVQITTNVATVMAEIGKNVKIVDLGGGNKGGGNVLMDALASVPELLAKMDIVNQAVSPDGSTFGETVSKLVKSFTSGNTNNIPEKAGEAQDSSYSPDAK